jgi:hypothetical protein
MNFVSQKGQDRWIIEDVFFGKRNGYFLDLAASDGLSINNTILLERAFGWSGIAIEADPTLASQLFANRSCLCVPACIDEVAREVEYLRNGELGGILATDTDNCPRIRSALIEEKRAAGEVVNFETATLADVLDAGKAPKLIDYFSFDVEGAETRILRSFPFDRYTFTAMTIERPTPELNELLFRNGYIFVKNVSYDSFYVHNGFCGLNKLHRDPFEQIPPKDW